MTKPMTPEEFFGSGGAPSFKFTNPGDTVTGTITDLKVVQQTTFNPAGGPGEPKTWPSGEPMMQLNVTLQTTLRDPSIEDDDGKRRVYIQGKRLREAVQAAFRAVGANHLEIGGSYTQTFSGYDPDSKNPANPAKVYAVTYARPNPAAGFFNTTQPTQAAPQPAPAPQPVPAPVTPQPATQATPAAVAVDPGALAAALGNLDPAVLAAIQASQAARTG